MTISLHALARDGTLGDQFGFAKAISADTIMVGAPFESHDTNNDGSDEFTVGAAYLFERNQGGPTPTPGVKSQNSWRVTMRQMTNLASLWRSVAR
jgi:FG-GAP repeat